MQSLPLFVSQDATQLPSVMSDSTRLGAAAPAGMQQQRDIFEPAVPATAASTTSAPAPAAVVARPPSRDERLVHLAFKGSLSLAVVIIFASSNERRFLEVVVHAALPGLLVGLAMAQAGDFKSDDPLRQAGLNVASVYAAVTVAAIAGLGLTSVSQK